MSLNFDMPNIQGKFRIQCVVFQILVKFGHTLNEGIFTLKIADKISELINVNMF